MLSEKDLKSLVLKEVSVAQTAQQSEMFDSNLSKRDVTRVTDNPCYNDEIFTD